MNEKLTFEIIWILREMRQKKKKNERKRMKEKENRKEKKDKQTNKIWFSNCKVYFIN